jgi:NAD(P)-dependent dehydrogenase (short-subunit alcohol dehydrogenase family)
MSLYISKGNSGMNTHPAFAADNVAVITGAADGIGLAAAKRYAAMGLKVCMADIDADRLAEATAAIEGAMAIPTDSSDLEQVQALQQQVLSAHGRVDVLMNNAGIGRPTSSWTEYENWRDVLNVNLWGAINGVQVFTQGMIDQATPGLIINTGSKQGITSPPGNPAYNVSKAAIKALTEALQHDLRNTANCQLSAHLLVPGFTYTGMMRQWLPEKPAGAWTAEQVVEFLVDGVTRGDFYILCPDNDVDRATDNKRMEWAMGDLVHNRPPLSRWHPDYSEAFAAFMAAD